MYKEHFGLTKKPFVLAPDPAFIFMSKGHDIAFTHLEYGLLNNMGFIALTGDVGAGKTTLIKFLFEKIKDKMEIATIFNTNLSPQTLLEMLIKEFELPFTSTSKSDLFERLAEYFLEQYSQGRRCIIIVDEAQNLPDETFEELRMLSNLELDSEFLIQIILVGQPQLKTRLSQPSLRQLAQRISVFYHLSALSESEVAEYINHRLRVAGYNKKEPLFDNDAVNYIAKMSGGIPRLINSICDAALTYAFADNLNKIDLELVKKVIEDNELLTVLNQETPDDSPSPIVDMSTSSNLLQEQIVTKFSLELSSLGQRLKELEERIKALESGQNDRVISMLERILATERQKNIDLARDLTSLSYKYQILERKMDEEENTGGEEENKGSKGFRFWESFNAKKFFS